MFPSNPSVYPEFVADQLLTAHDLNELFGYLDEQGRMTRTNLIGIGIVCGLQVQVNATQTQITITKGVGVTSLGYLVSVPTTTYSKYILYDSKVKEKTYDRFVNDGPPKSNKFNVWELAQASVYPEALDITPDFLEDKIVMIFVELLEVGNKNCDPNSCDDKGKHTEVRFVPMLVGQEDALTLIGSMGSTITADTFAGLPEIRMRRFDVPNTNPVTSEDIFNAYKSVLNTTFLSATENSLTQSYNAFSVFITADFPSNPFSGLAADFAFINNGTITVDQLRHIQYYYDLFSDFLLAYKEFRKTGMAIMSACCPDAGLFPRHLLLGEAIPLPGNVKSSLRHYFIYSPLFEQKSLLNELKSLFRKMVLLMEKFLIPPVNSGSPSSKTDPYIRITPSLLEDVGLSKKAIPYYYNPVSGTTQLYKFWDFEKTTQGRPQFNLSYNANQYNAADDFIINPLKYDLEPYNFLRIEGIIGKQYAHVLKNIKYQIGINRLPFDIIALNTDNIKLSNGIKIANLISSESLSSASFAGSNDFIATNLASGSSSSANTSSFATSAISADLSSAIRDLGIRDGLEAMCHFQDLEAMYATMKNEMLCMLCKELKYYYDLRYNFNTRPNTGAGAATAEVLSVVGLFNTCSPGYIVKQGTFGFLIEKVYKVVGNEGNITIQAIADALDIENILTMDMNGDGLPDINSPALATMVGFITNLFAVPIYIIRLANTFTSSLSTFDPEKYCAIHQLLVQNANSLKFVFNMVTAADKQALRAETTNVFNSDVNVNTAPVDANNVNRSGTINRSFLSSMAVSQSNMGRMLLLVLLLEDFFDHLDTLIYNCKCSAFKALKAEYLRRLLYLEKLRQFGYFTKLHPGIQHKAGVPMGGTFIIVYHSRSARGTTTGVFGITGFVRDLAGAAMVGAVVLVRGTTAGAITDANGQFKFTVNELPVTVTVLINGVEAKQVIVNSQEPVIIIVGSDDDDDTQNESLSDSIAEGTVIADFYLPYRCCSDCPPIQYIINEKTLPAPADQLTVNAGPDLEITLPDDKVTVNGSATPATGNTIASFSWIQLSPAGAQARILKPDNTQTDITELKEGTYRFELTVKDDKGNTSRDDLFVKVNPAIQVGQPPVANAGEDITLVLGTASVILDGTGSSNPETGVLDYLWEQENISSAPGIASIMANKLDKTGVTITAPGIYEFKLTVKNRFGLTNSDTVKVTAEAPPNQPPVANAGGNISVILPGTAILNGSLSKDPEGSVLEYAWKFESGPDSTAVIDNPTFAVTKVRELIPGTYKFKLTVKDDNGATAEDIATVTVTSREQTEKTCSDFPKIIGLFNDFPGIDQDNFGRFREFFRPYDTEIVPLFEKFGPGGINVTGLSVNKQIDFFGSLVLTVRNAAGATINVSIVDALQKWLQELSDLVVVRANDTAAVAATKNMFRIQVMALYRILLQLVTYIICIQKEDFNTARVPMDTVMKMVQAHIDEWEANILQFTEKEIDMIGFIGDDLKAEEQRVNNNGEAGIKTKYLSMLRKIIQVIDSIP